MRIEHMWMALSGSLFKKVYRSSCPVRAPLMKRIKTFRVSGGSRAHDSLSVLPRR